MNPLGLLLPVLASATAFESNMMAEDPRFALPVYIRGELQGYDSISQPSRPATSRSSSMAATRTRTP
jgi:hypothetical protein